MPKLSEAERGLTKRVLVYGDPGTGKSQLVSQLANKHNLLWFDLERGSDVLFKLPREEQERVELIRIPDSKSNPIACETMLKIIKRVKGKICYEHGKFNCPICSKKPDYDKQSDDVDMQEQAATNKGIVVVDSLTQLKASCIAHITKGKGEDYKLQHDDWAKLGMMMETFLSEVQSASYDIVCISHSDMIEKIDGKDQIVPVSGTRNFSRNTGRYFTDVVYADVKNSKHKFASSTTYQNMIQTKSRSDIKLEDMEVPSLLPFFEHRTPV